MRRRSRPAADHVTRSAATATRVVSIATALVSRGRVKALGMVRDMTEWQLEVAVDGPARKDLIPALCATGATVIETNSHDSGPANGLRLLVFAPDDAEHADLCARLIRSWLDAQSATRVPIVGL